jgi:group II intron reverse transcriptase/maturase
VEGKGGHVMEPLEGQMTDTPRSDSVYTKRQRIAELAKQMSGKALTSLSHHIDIEWLHEAYRRTRKDGATGIDGQTAAEYGEALDGNLESLLARAKSGKYLAPPVRRVRIPKGDGKETRPLGIPTFEDKVLQRAVAMVLEPVYEQDFENFSYGFRPGRSAHQAVVRLREELMKMWGGFVIEVDIRSYFDEIGRGQLREVLHERVRDGVVLRLIGKWLKAGVLEDGAVTRPEAGTPQGGVISPLLANIFLHTVFDRWFEEEVKPRTKGPVVAVRYADDIVIGVKRKDDAERIMEVLPKRFGRYGLRLHPDKTRMVPFHRPLPGRRRKEIPTDGRPGIFDFLGFRFYWGQSKRGKWIIKEQTSPTRLRRAIRRVWEWCRCHRHEQLEEQHQNLCRQLEGHYAYYGVKGNSKALWMFCDRVKEAWRRWLFRRSDRGKRTWMWINRIFRRYPLPAPRVVHDLIAMRSEAMP